MKIGRVTMSDRASKGIYDDLSGPAIETVLKDSFNESIEFCVKLVSDDQHLIVEALKDLIDNQHCNLVVTTGGTGPSERDVTPEATKEIITKELLGFGELMRMESYKIVKTAILSRATAGIYNQALIINLPGKPSAIGECLPLLLPAIAEGMSHICDFRPKLK
tara:strand:- start:382 stop:870 length:489 start_codon:yes stop_codon:yes gene_type:complete